MEVSSGLDYSYGRIGGSSFSISLSERLISISKIWAEESSS